MTTTPPANILNQFCPSRQAIALIAEKWTLLVLFAPCGGTRRYSHLLQMIEGVSKKMLTQTLRQLESHGLVERHVYPVIPPMVEYTLTPLGFTLVNVLRPVYRWAEEHMDDVKQIKEQYDSDEVYHEA